jgi:hypothetical protein
MGNPGLLQELQAVQALLPQGGGDCEQASAADRALCGLDAMADFSLNHRLAKGSFCGVIGGRNPLNLQEGPGAIGHWQQLMADAHRLSPRRSLALLVVMLHHPLEHDHKRLGDCWISWGCWSPGSGGSLRSHRMVQHHKKSPDYPVRRFRDLLSVRAWVDGFVDWYNAEHRHSGIKYVTPNQRHFGEADAICRACQQTYEQARAKHPRRWARLPRDWSQPKVVIIYHTRAQDTVAA